MIIEKRFSVNEEIFDIRFFQEVLLIFKTNRFMTINSVYFEQDDLLEDKIKFSRFLILILNFRLNHTYHIYVVEM
jgi:hypothetical protein